MAVLGTTTYDADNIFISVDSVQRKYPVAAGNTLKRGQVVKLSGGKLSPALTTETAAFVMYQDVDASAADTYGDYLVAGKVKEDQLDYNTGTADEFREQLRSVGIILV